MLVGADATRLAENSGGRQIFRKGRWIFGKGTTSVVPLIDAIELGFSP
jgi:hypothetical protein